MVARDIGDFGKRGHSFGIGGHEFDVLVEGYRGEEVMEEEGDG